MAARLSIPTSTPPSNTTRVCSKCSPRHCHAGWGEVEVHLHHGIPHPDTAENTRQLLTEFRDRLAFRHRCLAVEEGSTLPRYAFVHGNFALANSAAGRLCGVDSEMQILAETGCYADMTLPTAYWHPAQTEKINSVYECALPLDQAAPHRKGRDLVAGRVPETFPLIVQGPLVTDLRRTLAFCPARFRQRLHYRIQSRDSVPVLPLEAGASPRRSTVPTGCSLNCIAIAWTRPSKTP